MKKKMYILLSLFMLGMSILLLASQWKFLPQMLPAHIGLKGTTSGSMAKWVIWFMPILQIIISVLLFLPISKSTMRFLNVPYKSKILKLSDVEFDKIKPLISELFVSIVLWVNFLFYYILKFYIAFVLKKTYPNLRLYIFIILVLLIVLVFYSSYKIKKEISIMENK